MNLGNAIKTAAAVVVVTLAVTQPASADPHPNIDWDELEDLMQGTGDHVVGEELCAKPR